LKRNLVEIWSIGMLIKRLASFFKTEQILMSPSRSTAITYRLALVFLLWITIVTPVQSQQISIGIRSPVKPFMWQQGKSFDDSVLNKKYKHRWRFLAANIQHIPVWGGQWNIVNISQWLNEGKDYARLHKIIEEHEKYGLLVVLRVLEDPRAYEHLFTTESAEFGYNKSYFHWIQSLIRSLDGKVKCVLIGNEVEINSNKFHHEVAGIPKNLSINYDQYSKLLLTAVKAIKSVDPSILVANGGFSDLSLALALSNELLESRGLNEAHEFWSSWKEQSGIKAEGRLGLYRLLKSREAKRKIEFVRRALREPMGCDLYQFHYYRNWRALQPMLNWIKKEMQSVNAARPIIAAEVGYRIMISKTKDGNGMVRKVLDKSYYSEVDHASNIIKIFAILLGNGVQKALYWNMRNSDDYGSVVPLFESTDDPEQFKTGPVNLAFRMLSETLNGLSPAQGRLPKRSDVWEFRFVGKSDVSLVWSDGYDLAAMLRDAREVRDMDGHLISSSGNEKPLVGPVYIFW